MEREDKWYDNGKSWKDKPEDLDFALSMGYVDILERGLKKDNVGIAHSANKESHILGFLLKEGAEALDKSIDDDI